MLGFFVLFAVAGYLLYRFLVAKYNVLAERGVPHEKPVPLFGNTLQIFLKKPSFWQYTIDQYRKYRQNKVYGYYNFRDPNFFITDPTIIRDICIKDFVSFTNHMGLVEADSDKIFMNMLTSMRDQRWKDMRNTLTPIFTGAKMRTMFTLMLECFKESMNHVREKANGAKSLDIDLHDCFARLSSDLIATTAFGVQVNSFKENDNQFFKLGMGLSKLHSKQLVRFLLYTIVPKVAQFLRLRLMPPESTNFFMKLVVDAMKYREQHNIHRPDMIGLLMEAQKESPHHWTQEEIVAQCFIFFFAAFQNNANLLCITCQLLMENPDAQERLYQEIVEVDNNLNGKNMNYDTLNTMEYMDMVVNETLRLWPLTFVLDRECNKDYTVRDENESVVCELKKGDRVLIPIAGIHRDEQYFEEPEAFKPERFSKENKANIKTGTYMPFGLGLRNCIGNRYALMQGKAKLYYLLREYRIERSEKSVKDLMKDIKFMDVVPKDGFWFKLVPRSQ